MTTENRRMTIQHQEGLRRLGQPILPLVRMVLFLYLTGKFKRISELLAELKEPVSTNDAKYEDPAALLNVFLPELQNFERIKKPAAWADFPLVLDLKHKPLDRIKTMELWVCQQILTKELEAINSLLCEPCGCVLCCVGPDYGEDPAGKAKKMRQEFFEIPLRPEEVARFDLYGMNNADSQAVTAESEPPLERDGRPFYQAGPALYHWRTGWSLVLPRYSACPNLAAVTGQCRIYPERPEVCRRPQIFPYILERQPELDQVEAGKHQEAYVMRNSILAVWDCPYVRDYQDEISSYALASRLEPVYRKNKG